MKLRDNEIGYNKSLIMQLILLMIESISIWSCKTLDMLNFSPTTKVMPY